MTKDAGGSSPAISRRALLAGTAATAGAALLGSLPDVIRGQESPATPAGPPSEPRVPGQPTSATSVRSSFEHPARTPIGQVTGASFSP
ncbi:MAG: twin-arginine translocation signal domain-containing protein, partial [Gemmatimonadales bacterium]